MKGYVHSIEKAAQQNATFRTVLYTAKNCQLVVMSLKPGEDIGVEVHKLDQFLPSSCIFSTPIGRTLMTAPGRSIGYWRQDVDRIAIRDSV